MGVPQPPPRCVPTHLPLIPRATRRAWRWQRRPRRGPRRARAPRGSRPPRSCGRPGDPRHLRHLGLPRSRDGRGWGKVGRQKRLKRQARKRGVTPTAAEGRPRDRGPRRRAVPSSGPSVAPPAMTSSRRRAGPNSCNPPPTGTRAHRWKRRGRASPHGPSVPRLVDGALCEDEAIIPAK